MDTVRFDVVVVGGGLAGVSAALAARRAGCTVAVVERGRYSGAKNAGGLLYSPRLAEIIPDFYNRAPFERPVSKRGLFFLDTERHAGLEFGAEEWSRPPFNHSLVVYRAVFDRWYAEQAAAEDVEIFPETVAEALLLEGAGAAARVTGIRLRNGETIRANVVILADGSNALLTEQAIETLKLRPAQRQPVFALGVKEIIALPRTVIEDRFGLAEKEGAALDFFGRPFDGLAGGGFIYTADEALHVGAVARVAALAQADLNPNDVLERFKRHPVIQRYVRGGELQEYSAHMIPEGGYDTLPQVYAAGLLIAGDAAGFVNLSLYKEGTNHAVESGWLAGQVAADAHQRKDFSSAALAEYERRLRASSVFKDLKQYRHAAAVLETTPALLGDYPAAFTRLLTDWFAMDGRSKRAIQKSAFGRLWRSLPKARFLRDLFRARKII